jgi:hypothetical protein
MNGHLRRVAARAWTPPSIRADQGITPLSLARLAAHQKVTSTTATDPRTQHRSAADPPEPALDGRRDTAVASVVELVPPPATRSTATSPQPADQGPLARSVGHDRAPEDAGVQGEPRRTRRPVEPGSATVPVPLVATRPADTGVPRAEARREDAADPRPRPAVVVRRQASARPAEGQRDRQREPVVVRIGRVELTLSASAPTPTTSPRSGNAAASRAVVTHPDLLTAHRSYLQRGSGT